MSEREREREREKEGGRERESVCVCMCGIVAYLFIHIAREFCGPFCTQGNGCIEQRDVRVAAGYQC